MEYEVVLKSFQRSLNRIERKKYKNKRREGKKETQETPHY